MYVTFTNFISLGVTWALLSKGFLCAIEGFPCIFFHVLGLENSSCSIYNFIKVFVDYLRLVNLDTLFFLKSVS